MMKRRSIPGKSTTMTKVCWSQRHDPDAPGGKHLQSERGLEVLHLRAPVVLGEIEAGASPSSLTPTLWRLTMSLRLVTGSNQSGEPQSTRLMMRQLLKRRHTCRLDVERQLQPHLSQLGESAMRVRRRLKRPKTNHSAHQVLPRSLLHHETLRV